jgi:hypothetical protein
VNEEIVVERRFRYMTVLRSYLNLSRTVSFGFLEHFRVGELPVLVLSKTSKTRWFKNQKRTDGF